MYIPEYALELVERLEENGYKTYLVGGSVRDQLLGLEPKDYDLATRARPDEIEKVFYDKTKILVGKAFGTINIVNQGQNIEVTSFRSDGNYSDGRKPDRVEFSDSIIEDLRRRDFTINAMAYRKEDGLVDPFKGREDLERKIIRSVGKPDERLEEDYLRILRAIRFATSLDFDIEEETAHAMKKYGKNLSLISRERIRDEFFKILLSKKPSKGIRLLEEMDILKLLFEDLDSMIGFDQQNPNHSLDLYNHSLCVMDRVGKDLSLRLAGLFHDLGKLKTFSLDDEGVGHFYGHQYESVEMTKSILKSLNTSRELIKDVSLLISYHMNSKDDFKTKGLKRLIRKLGQENIYKLLELQIADTSCSNGRDEDIRRIEARKIEVDKILEEGQVYNERQLKISGKDLIRLGYKEGKLIGEILNYLYEMVLEDESLNNLASLQALALDSYPINNC